MQYVRPRPRGFTLIELMITVAIIAILASVAYPSYTQYVVRSNRASAQAFMLEVTSMQQRFLLDARTYADSLSALGTATPSSLSPHYTITTAAKANAIPPGFTVTATPVSGSAQARNDSRCGTLTIDETTTKTASGAGGVSECWRQ